MIPNKTVVEIESTNWPQWNGERGVVKAVDPLLCHDGVTRDGATVRLDRIALSVIFLTSDLRVVGEQ